MWKTGLKRLVSFHEYHLSIPQKQNYLITLQHPLLFSRIFADAILRSVQKWETDSISLLANVTSSSTPFSDHLATIFYREKPKNVYRAKKESPGIGQFPRKSPSNNRLSQESLLLPPSPLYRRKCSLAWKWNAEIRGKKGWRIMDFRGKKNSFCTTLLLSSLLGTGMVIILVAWPCMYALMSANLWINMLVSWSYICLAFM